ncbi:MAG: OmpA family protein [Candidatus Kuenenia sp.]|nr:OmpA family protein [Candidatus Kuenenia hertensis]
MRKTCLLVSLTAMIIAVLTGCAQLQSVMPEKKPLSPLESFTPQNLNSKALSVKYVPKIESFVIILDASASMETAFTGTVNQGHSKFTVAKDILSRMNKTLPEVDINSALVTFGHGFFTPLDKTFIVYELTHHSQDLLENALTRAVYPKGSSPAGDAIEDASNQLLMTVGQAAIIFVSDGEELTGSPLAKVKNLKEMYGEKVCFYTIHAGNTAEGKAALRELAREAKCGFSVTADEIASSENMANFVKEVFLTAIPKQDSDGDGVYDEDDECPDTPEGAIVDSRGCWVVKGVTFEYKKWDIKEEFDSNLGNIVDILEKNPDMQIRIEGHTDNIGSLEYNIDLSQKRAQAVKNYLVGKGINESRISTVGFGFKKPIAPNTTEEGRALNRRAEIVPVK